MPVHPRVEAALNLIDVWLDAHCAFQGLPGVSAGVVSPTHRPRPAVPPPPLLLTGQTALRALPSGA